MLSTAYLVVHDLCFFNMGTIPSVLPRTAFPGYTPVVGPRDENKPFDTRSGVQLSIQQDSSSLFVKGFHTCWQQDLRPTPLMPPKPPTVSQLVHCFPNVGSTPADPPTKSASPQ